MKIKLYSYVTPVLLALALNVNAQTNRPVTNRPVTNSEACGNVPLQEIRSANTKKEKEAELRKHELPPDSIHISLLKVLLRGLMSFHGSDNESPKQVPPPLEYPFYPNSTTRIPNSGITFPRRKKEEDAEGDGPPKGKSSKKKKRTNPFTDPPKLKHQRSGPLFQWSAPNIFYRKPGPGPTTRKYVPPENQPSAKKSTKKR
jgi:hypothetical protein